MNPANAAPDPLPPLGLSWGIKRSFIDYISGLGWISYAACQMGPGDDGLRFADLSVQEAEQFQSPIYLGGARIWRSHALMAVRRLDEATAARQPNLRWRGMTGRQMPCPD